MKPNDSYRLWLKRRVEYADGLAGEARAKEIARVRSSIADFKARNLDKLGAGFFDLMLADLDKAGSAQPKAKPTTEAGAFD